MDLHPAENRGYRELFLTSRQGASRLEKLAGHFEGSETAAAIGAGSDALLRTLDELRPVIEAHGLFSELAAEGSGARAGGFRAAVVDRFLERNQALRLAVYDLEHAATLLAYLAAVSETAGHADLAEASQRGERRLRRHVNAVRRAAVELGSDPGAAIEPLDDSKLGRAAHRVGWVWGTVGEWTDRQAARRKRGGQ